MPIENDFTRVFGAIKELEERVEALELGATVEDDGTMEWQPWEPDYKALFEGEQLESERLRKALLDETERASGLFRKLSNVTDKQQDSAYRIARLEQKIDVLKNLRLDDADALDDVIDQNNQLRFVLSILAAVKDDGWIEWHGGECPVLGLTPVDFQSRCGDVLYGEIASDLTWEHEDGAWDIIAYRIAR
jgi:hypothetical protein